MTADLQGDTIQIQVATMGKRLLDLMLKQLISDGLVGQLKLHTVTDEEIRQGIR